MAIVVYMSFRCRNGWHSKFLESNLKTILPVKLHLIQSDRIIELAQPGRGFSIGRPGKA